MSKTIKLLSSVLIIALLLLISSDIDAQRRRGKKKKRKSRRSEKIEDIKPFKDNIWYGANGGLQLNNQYFVVGLSPMAGYKFTNWLSAGPIINLNYTAIKYYNKYTSKNENLKSFDFGAGAFVRAKFLSQFFFQTEYDYSSVKRFTDRGGLITAERTGLAEFLLGLGYHTSSENQWGYQASIMYDVLIKDSSSLLPFSYKIGFVYNL